METVIMSHKQQKYLISSTLSFISTIVWDYSQSALSLEF